MSEQTSVLVAGGGPVGLTTALFLARQGVRPIVVERRPGLSEIPRATGLHARTMELFRSAGLERQIADAGLEIVGPGKEPEKVKAGRATPLLMLGAPSIAELGNAFVLESHDVPYAEFTPSRPIWCGQDHYEPIIYKEAVALGADIRFNSEVVHIEQDDDGVTAEVFDRAAGGRRTIRADYVVAADGVRSSARDLLGIGHRSHGVAGHFVSIIFKADIKIPAEAPAFTLMYLLNPKAQGLVLFIEPGRWMFGVNYYPEQGQSPSDFTEERCVELVRIAAGQPDLEVDVESFTPWDAKHMVADTFRSGRVFLAGDACHAHPPAGGFGVNAGVQDAHNLAWKLAAVVNGWADESLLDSYDAERRPVGAGTADQAWMLFRSRGQLADEDKEMFRDFVVVTMGYHYTSNAVLQDGAEAELMPRELRFTAEPGTRAPHGWLAGKVGKESTVDIVGDAFVLLSASEGWAKAAQDAEREFGIPLRHHDISADGDVPVEDGWWRDTCGLPERGALLVRPDGFVAWRCDDPDADAGTALKEALGRVLGRVPVKGKP